MENEVLEWKLFQDKMKKQAEDYRKEGMSQQSIDQMYEYDLKWHNNKRTAARHNISLDLIEEIINENPNHIYGKQLSKVTATIERSKSDLFWWVDEIEDERLLKAVREMSPLCRLVISRVVFQGFSQKEAAEIIGITQPAVNYQLNTIARNAMIRNGLGPKDATISVQKRVKPIEMCLCSRCASVYYDSKEHYIMRVNPRQTVFDSCDICRHPHGYDFRIWRNGSNRRVEGGKKNG